MRLHLSFVVASVIVALSPEVATASTPATGSPAFCSATNSLFAAPSWLAQHWPEVATSTVNQSAVLHTVQDLNNYNPNVFVAMATSAPTKAIATTLSNLGRTANSELALVTKVWYGTVAKGKRASTLQQSKNLGELIRHQMQTISPTLVRDCAPFPDQALVNVFALTLTTRAAEQGFANGGLPNAYTFATAQKNESHQVLVEQLVLRGPSSSVAKLRVATVRGYVTVCTSIPGSAGVVSKIVHC